MGEHVPVTDSRRIIPADDVHTEWRFIQEVPFFDPSCLLRVILMSEERHEEPQASLKMDKDGCREDEEEQSFRSNIVLKHVTAGIRHRVGLTKHPH